MHYYLSKVRIVSSNVGQTRADLSFELSIRVVDELHKEWSGPLVDHSLSQFLIVFAYLT